MERILRGINGGKKKKKALLKVLNVFLFFVPSETFFICNKLVLESQLINRKIFLFSTKQNILTKLFCKNLSIFFHGMIFMGN